MDVSTVPKQIADIANAASGETSLTSIIIIITVVSSLFVATAWPVVKMIKKFVSDKDIDILKNEAESLLYGRLVEQISEARTELDLARAENKELWELIKKLENRISRLENLRTEYELLKKILNSKEEELAVKNSIIASLKADIVKKTEEIKELQETISTLECHIDKLTDIVGSSKIGPQGVQGVQGIQGQQGVPGDRGETGGN